MSLSLKIDADSEVLFCAETGLDYGYSYQAVWGDARVIMQTTRSETRSFAQHVIRSNLASAVMLGELEAICQCIEQLLDSPLVFRPIETLSDHESEALLWARFSIADVGAVDVAFPISAWETLERTWGIERSVDVTWLRVPATLELAEMQLTRSDAEKLDVASLILLPPSFQENWKCTLNVAHLHVCKMCIVEVNDELFRARMSPQTTHETRQIATTAREAVRVYLESSLMVDPALLLDPGQDPNVALSVDMQDAFCRCVTQRRGTLTGPLMPLGDGFGLFIQARH